MNFDFKKFTSSEILATNIAIDISSILQDKIVKNGFATLLVSGGETPKLFFQKLSQIDIPWDKIIIGLVDERWIDSNLLDSNEYLVKKNLAINFAKNAKFIPLYNAEVSIDSAETFCSKIYYKNFKEIDVLILGMGQDGHTASLFPNNEKLSIAFDLTNQNFCISIFPESAKYQRISLTLKKILEAQNVFLHFEGVEKLQVFNTLIKTNDIYRYPISNILNKSKKNIKIYYSDK